MDASVAESKESEVPQKRPSSDSNGNTADPGLNFKTGQRYTTPSPGSGDRVFYETLLEQKPDSEMAQDWCVAYGVLDEERAAKLYSKILNRKVKRNNSPAPAKKRPVEASAKSSAVSKPRKIRDDDDIVGDTGTTEIKCPARSFGIVCIYLCYLVYKLGMDAGSAWEGRGTTGI